jgi:hypothetical protein
MQLHLNGELFSIYKASLFRGFVFKKFYSEFIAFRNWQINCIYAVMVCGF